MKLIFTKRFLIEKLLLSLITIFLVNSEMFGQVVVSNVTENFEDDVPCEGSNTATSLTFSQSGVSFSTTNKLRVRTNSIFGADNTCSFLESDGAATNEANLGPVSITTPSTTFVINSFSAYTGTNNGNTSAAGTITFIGTKPDGSTVSETISVPNAGGAVTNNLSFSGNLQNVQIVSFRLTLGGNINYVELDKINFSTAAVASTQYSINSVSQTEGNSGTTNFNFTVSRTSSSGTGSVTVNTANVSATAGSDYTAVSNQVVNFANGESTKTVAVTVFGETTVEPDETFSVNLSSPVNGSIQGATGIGTILDDDGVLETFETETTNSQNFSQNGFSFSSTGSLRVAGAGGSNSTKSLDTGVGNGGNTANTAVGTFGITTPSTSFNIVSIDALPSSNDGTSGTNGNITFIGTKADNSGTVSHTFSVTSSAGTYGALSFTGTPFDGVQLISISVTIGTGLNYVALDNFRFGTGTIITPQVSISDVSIIEGTGAGNTNAVFTITRNVNTSAFSVDVAFSHVTTTAADFAATFSPTTLNFTSGGGLSQTVTVQINRDNIAEPNETFQMTLSNATNSTQLLDAIGVGTILDDESVVETFEDETNNATVFAQNGLTFSSSGDLRVRNSINFGSGSSDFFLDTGAGNGASSGNVGSITATTSNKGFKLLSVDGWTSNNDGSTHATGVVTFRGTRYGGGTVQTNKTITPTNSTGTGWQQNISFIGTPLEGEVLSSLEIIIVSGINHIGIDNFRFEIIDLLPEIDVVDASDNAIAFGGSNSPAAGNNTAFGNACVTSGTASKTYTIKNLATLGSMTVGTVTVSPNTHFSIQTQPNGTISANGTSTFTVLFDPSASGTHTAVISIPNNDSDEAPYTFNISGVGVANPAAPTSPTATPSTVCGTETITLSASGCSGGTLTWYDASNNSTVSSTPTVSTNKSFYATCTSSGCTSVASSNVNVSEITPLGVSPGNVDITWTGAIDTDWSKPCNWSPAWVPDLTNKDAIIPDVPNKPIIGLATIAEINSIRINANSSLTVNGTLNVRSVNSSTIAITLNGATLTNNGTIRVETASGNPVTGFAMTTQGLGDISIINNGTLTLNSTVDDLQFGGSNSTVSLTNNSIGTINFKGTNDTRGIAFLGSNPNPRTFINNGTLNFDLGTGWESMTMNAATVFTNTGTVNMNLSKGILGNGATINNNSCGKIIMASGSYLGVGTTNNSGLIQLPSTYNFTNTGTFTK